MFSPEAATAAQRPAVALLREVIEPLAALERAPGSAGEREAARRIAARLRDAGARDVRLEPVDVSPGFAAPFAALAATWTAGALLAAPGAGRARRAAGAALALAGGAVFADDVSGGARVLRDRLPRRPTENVVAEVGDPDAERTLAVLAHHDAAQPAIVLDQTWHEEAHRRFPALIERTDTPPPQWWPMLGGPLLTAWAAARRSRRARRWAVGLGALGALAMADMARGGPVPGANDNLTAVGALVALAEAVRDRPLRGVRVLLVSAAAEESLQEGIRPFLRDHAAELPVDRTWFLVLDTIGSGNLVLLEGEGPLRMEEYAVPAFRDAVQAVADAQGERLRRGMRARASTDAIVPSRAGHPTAAIVSLDHKKALANYHQHSDVPENLDWGCVAAGARIAEGVARALQPA